MYDNQKKSLITKCKLFYVCNKFMDRYLEIGRNDLYNQYLTDYCSVENQYLCKRKQYYNKYNELPDEGMTPTGDFSFVQKIFMSDP